MAGPWEKYQTGTPQGPWSKYAATQPAATDAPPAPSLAEDIAKSFATGVEKAPGWLNDMTGAMTQGVTRLGGAAYTALGGELTPEQARALTYPVTPATSTEMLTAAGLPIHEPQSGWGVAAEILGGGMTGVAGPKAATAVTDATNAAAKTAARAFSPLQSPAMAQDKALDTAAKLLARQGDLTPEQLIARVAEAKASGTGATLAEATGSRDLLARQKAIAKGSGKAANDLTAFLKARNEQTVPQAVAALAEPLAAKGQQGLEELGQVLAQSGAKPVPVDDIVNGLIDKASRANPANAEGRIYKAVLDELAFAEHRGNTFEALHRAKQGLDKLFVEGADDTLRARATALTKGVRQALNDRLRTIDPAYESANRKIQAGMVADDLSAALNATNEGSVAALYNKLWAKPELRAEVAQKLDPADYARVSRAMDALKSIKQGGMGGSDTAERLATSGEMALETGAPGLEALTDPARAFGLNALAERVSNAVRQKDLQAMQALLRDPDAAEIARRMAQRMTPGEANQLIGVGRSDVPAAMATGAAGTLSTDPQPSPSTPPAAVPPQPQPDTEPTPKPLIDRIAKAESGGNPNATNPQGTASGLLQFTNPTWQSSVARWGKELGVDLKDKNDPQAQIAVGQQLMAENAAQLQRALRRAPTDGEQYAAWFLGPMAATKLVLSQGSGRDAVTLFPRKVVSDNRPVFFEGQRPRSVEEVMNLMNQKVS